MSGGGRLPLRAFARAFAICILACSAARAYDRYGADPGYYGFPLRYHSVYGYGGRGLGVGVFGGYPYYGGPGYPCMEPGLNRCGKIIPFPFNGGPGYPRYGHTRTTSNRPARSSSTIALSLSKTLPIPVISAPSPAHFPIPKRTLPLTRPRPRLARSSTGATTLTLPRGYHCEHNFRIAGSREVVVRSKLNCRRIPIRRVAGFSRQGGDLIHAPSLEQATPSLGRSP